jgi:protein required for attachment to host cells
MLKLDRNGWVAVFDGGRLNLYRNDATPPALDLKPVASRAQANPPTRELGTGAPPRTNNSLGRRSAMETPDYHQVAEDRFVQEVASGLVSNLARGAFTQIVIVAPPTALSVFRKAMTPELRGAMVLDIGKDLTKHGAKDIAGIVGKALEAASG